MEWGSYDPSKTPVMAFYKDNSETYASLKIGEFLASWVTISVPKTILLIGLLTVSDLHRVPFPKLLRNPKFT